MMSVQVETIGDAYMVSSGIPVPNPQHASELADMALALCHGVTEFKVVNQNLVFYRAIGDVQNNYTVSAHPRIPRDTLRNPMFIFEIGFGYC